MGYVGTHWHALLLGAGLWFLTERFILPRFMSQGG